jgi:hypothetical protein
MAWFIDKVLPGVITGVIMSAGTLLSHRRLKRHITGTADAQDGKTLAVLTELSLNTQLTEEVRKSVARPAPPPGS